MRLTERLASVLAKARPEGVPRIAAAALRVAFPGARCDVLARRRRKERRVWVPLAWKPADAPALSVEAISGKLPAAAILALGPGELAGLPGEADLAAAGPWHRLVAVVRSPEIKAVLSVARTEPFADADMEAMGKLAEALRPPLVTWARVERFRRALQRARFVQRLLGDVTRSMDLAEIAETTLKRLREQLIVDALMLVEPPAGQEAAAWFVAAGSRATRVRHAGRAASQERHDAIREASCKDLTADARDPWQEEAFARGYRSMLVLPLVTRRQPAGGLILLAREPGALGPEHLPVLWPAARPLASAVERARLFREASERSRQMTALYEVGQALNSPLDTAGVIERVLSILHDAFRFQASAVLTLEPGEDGEWLVMRASRGYSLREGGGFRMRVGERGVTSRAVTTGRLVYVPDVRQDPDYVKGVEAGRSEVAVPLQVGGRVVGVLDVESTQLNAFSAEDLETLKLFSTQVAIALERARLFDDVRRQAMTDGLTGLLNQRYFKEKVDREIDRSRRTGRPFALALIDVDDFKSINDEHGHVVGDQVIMAMGEILRARIRSIDAAARFGGDEFSLILSETGLDQGLRVADEVRKEVLERRPAGLPVSLSIGVAAWEPALITFRDIVTAADQALYRAKAEGKGRVVASQPADTGAEAG